MQCTVSSLPTELRSAKQNRHEKEHKQGYFFHASSVRRPVSLHNFSGMIRLVIYSFLLGADFPNAPYPNTHITDGIYRQTDNPEHSYFNWPYLKRNQRGTQMLVFAALLLLGFPLLLTLQKLVALPAFEDSHHQLYREPLNSITVNNLCCICCG